jgi:hypothetical protein
LALSIVYQSSVRDLLTWEAQTDILALEILEDGSILALESSQQQFIMFIAHIVSERTEKDDGELFLPGSLR